MPELPEVESVRLSLVPRLSGRLVVSAELLRRDVLVSPGDPPGGFSRQRAKKRRASATRDAAPLGPEDLLVGTRIVELRRRGKQLAVVGENARVLVVQLGMTGHFEIAAGEQRLTHTHAEWRLDDGSRLAFRDARRFGTLRVFRSVKDLEKHWQSLGPDALTISAGMLAANLANTKRAVKAALLDQSLIAGVGNIYADEALHRARIHPAARTDRLRYAEDKRLAQAIRHVLRAAIRAGGSTVDDYSDGAGRAGSYQERHRVYGRAGQPCLVCGRALSSGTLGQRTTVWCAICQPRGRGACREAW